jgi:hypothetical protein
VIASALCTEDRPATVVPCSVWFGPRVPLGTARELYAFLAARHGIAILHWPRDARHVETLAELGIPRLLLVHDISDTPDNADPNESWVRWPAPQEALHEALSGLAERRHCASSPSS